MVGFRGLEFRILAWGLGLGFCLQFLAWGLGFGVQGPTILGLYRG